MNEEIYCSNCNKPVFPVDLRNKDRNTWCRCERVGLPDRWWLDQGNKK